MFLSVLRKELRKLYVFWAAVLVFNIAVLGYVMTSVRRLFRMDHAEVVWYYAMHIGEIFYTPLMYMPLISGIFFAAAQFLPETRNERFRICLHLPVKPHYAVLWHVGAGLSALGVIFALDTLILWLGIGSYFPNEYALRSVLTFLPWIFAGVCGYLGTALVLLEPMWKLRVFNFIITAGVAGLFLQKSDAGAYMHIMPQSVLILLMFAAAVLLPAYNFRYRRV